MSREVIEMQEIRREKENIQKLMKRYQERNKELNVMEEMLIKKIETARSKEFDWRQLMEEGQHSEGYVICDSISRLSKMNETPEMTKDKIVKLREEVLQKQFENMKLEKELENRKEEHRLFHELLLKRKGALGQCLESECPTSLEDRKLSNRWRDGSVNNDKNKVLGNKFGSEQ